MNAENPTVLVTGSSGLLGTRITERLAGRYHVVGLDIAEPDHLPADASFIKFDLTEQASVDEALEKIRRERGDRIASVIHLAAYYDFSGEPSPLYDKITVQGTERLLRALQPYKVEQFCFSSTMLVHAPCEPGEKINEDSPLEPKWDYPQSKTKTEKLIREQRGNIPAVILRIAGVYTDRCDSPPLSNQIQRIRERWMTAHVFPGDTDRGQALVHLDDVVDAVDRAVAHRGRLPNETTALIGEPETLSYEELQRRFARLIHDEPDWETKRIPKPVAKTGAWFQDKAPVGQDPFIKPWMIEMADDHYELDITRARELIGWEPKHSLRDALPKMVEALQADPLAWYKAHKLEPPRKLEKQASR